MKIIPTFLKGMSVVHFSLQCIAMVCSPTQGWSFRKGIGIVADLVFWAVATGYTLTQAKRRVQKNGPKLCFLDEKHCFR